ncbi:MAG TPA: hypothetical protein VJA83_02315 [Sulfuricurvum sp.]|nr:hypothetical protein [Sulfuricurvum sp.]
MTVSSYIFQSPYSQPFQVGQPDPIMKQEQTEQLQEEGSEVQSETQTLTEQKSSFDEVQTQIKSSTLYANSEGFGMSAKQLNELSTVSKNSKKSDLVRIYSKSGE